MKNERAATADRFVMNARTLIVGEWHCPYPGERFLRAYLPPSIVFVPAVSAVRYLGVDARTEREANVSYVTQHGRDVGFGPIPDSCAAVNDSFGTASSSLSLRVLFKREEFEIGFLAPQLDLAQCHGD